MNSTLHTLLREYNIETSSAQIELLLEYRKMLLDWTENTNLIARSTIPDFDRIHLLDSLLPLQWLPEKGPLIDLGTGGGLPGIAIKILRPDLEVTLCETRSRKIKFLQKAVTTLNLKGLTVLNPSQEKTERQYRILVSRAFGPLSRIIREAKKYLLQDGIIFAYKGRMDTVNEEFKEVPPEWLRSTRRYNGPSDPDIAGNTERTIVLLHRKS